MSFAASLFATSGQSIGSDGHWILNRIAPKTFAGVQVSETGALCLTPVYAAVGIISDALAQLPIGVFQKSGDRREERPDHPVAQLLRNPNPLMTSAVMRGTLQSHALLWGNAYVDIQRSQGGKLMGLWPLLPDRTRATTEFGRDRSVVYATTVDGEQVSIQPKDVLHVPALGFDGIQGYSPIRLAREGIGLTFALEQFGSSFFGNDAKSGGYLEHPGKLSAEAKKSISESMAAQGGLDNAHRIKVLEEGMTFKATTIPPEDAQFLLTRTFQVEEIARLFRVPLHMLQSQSKTTSWGSGIAQMSLGFYRSTLEPWVIKWEQELSRKLFTPEESAAGFYVKHNVNSMLRPDPEGRANFYAKALDKAKGWMSRDEVRALEDLNPDDIQNESPQPGLAERTERRRPATAPADFDDDEENEEGDDS